MITLLKSNFPFGFPCRLNDALASEASNSHDIEEISKFRKYYHEEVLCTLKLYENGMLEVSPGFSLPVPEDIEDNFIFASNKSLQNRIRNGPFIAAFSFTSPRSGNMYQYTIEPRYLPNYHHDINLHDQILRKQTDSLFKLGIERRHRISTALKELHSEPDSTLDTVLIQFISATEFSPPYGYNSKLYIKYDCSLPRHWYLQQLIESRYRTKDDDEYESTSFENTISHEIFSNSTHETQPVLLDNECQELHPFFSNWKVSLFVLFTSTQMVCSKTRSLSS